MIKLAFSGKVRGRSWMVTIHESNMQKAGLTKEHYENPEYVANYFKDLWENSGKGRKAGISVCMSESNCYHCHMGCYGNTTTAKKVSDVLFQSHVEPQMGTKEQLKEYILKEGKYAEKNEKILFSIGLENIMDRQGSRSDLDIIEELIENGYSPEQIFEESFRYRKYEKMIKAHYLDKRIKETPLMKDMWNEYHWGRSGTGKTYSYIKLCERYSPEEVYLCNDYANSGASGGGFDFYANNPAKIVILDEFRGNIPYAQFLSMLDVYSRNQQHCRYHNTYNLWTSVIVCSIYPPEKVYSFMVDDTQKSVDSIQQLLRRINVIVYHYKNKDGKYRSFSLPASDYVGAEDMISKAIQYEKIADEVESLSNTILAEEIANYDINEMKRKFGMKDERE